MSSTVLQNFIFINTLFNDKIKEIEMHKNNLDSNPGVSYAEQSKLFISEAQKFYNANYRDVQHLKQTFNEINNKVSALFQLLESNLNSDLKKKLFFI